MADRKDVPGGAQVAVMARRAECAKYDKVRCAPRTACTFGRQLGLLHVAAETPRFALAVGRERRRLEVVKVGAAENLAWGWLLGRGAAIHEENYRNGG